LGFVTYICGMNSERFIRIILTDLSTDLMKTEEELERVINSVMDTDEKICLVKQLLEKISLIELSIAKFNSMISNNNNNKNLND
jgi:hypothetical protein